MLGYLGEPPLAPGPFATGDLAQIDSDGFVRIVGRKKNLFITAFGRNVSPEWVEAELIQQPAIAQALVHGEARAFNTAVLVARSEGRRVGQEWVSPVISRWAPDHKK